MLDIIGAVLLFRYGLPNRKATQTGVFEITSPEVAEHYDRMGGLGLLLLILGFLFQLAAIWQPWLVRLLAAAGLPPL